MKTSTTLGVLFGTATLGLAFSTPALAAESAIGLSFGLHSGSQASETNTLVAPRLDADIGVSDHFGVRVILPMTSLSRTNGQGTFRFGNPYAGGFWTTDLEVISLKLGAGLTLPAASFPEDAAELAPAIQAYNTAQGLAGLGDFWLYQPGTMALVVPLEARIDIPLVELRADATWALLISTSDRSNSDTALQLGGEVLFDLPFVAFGARVQSVWIPTTDGDAMQVSIAPLVELEAGPFYARTKFVINLDGPAGFSFDDNSSGSSKFWGWQLGAGVRF